LLCIAGQFGGQGDCHTPKPQVFQAFCKYPECGNLLSAKGLEVLIAGKNRPTGNTIRRDDELEGVRPVLLL